ncbi:MAG: plastocyanin/azurin family copper-binding protein [Candidatus Binatus sp.]|uniref:cupredoxin domain-containing protein n=1 Tax=Candidatus Binatus sp. TaxID=2811406 RepID=UPI003BB15A3D
MKKRQLTGRGLLVAGVLSLGLAMPAFAETVEVKMFDTPAKYVPDPVKIKVGDTVTWVDKGDTVHTATTDPTTAPDPSWAVVPKGAETWDSGYLNSGDTWSYTFKVPGTYKYFCTTHVKEGMKGEINVAQ